MPTLIECIAANLGITVDQLVGTDQIKSDLSLLQTQFSLQNSANTGLFNSLGTQLVNLQTQIDALNLGSITQADLDALDAAIQAQITTLSAAQTTSNSNLTLLADRVTTLEGKVSAAEAQLIVLAAVDNDVADRLARLQSNQTYAADADFTAQWLVTPHTTRLTTALTATRTVTLSATDAVPGARLRFVYSSTVGFNWNIGPGIRTVNPATWAEFEWDQPAAAWFLSARGNL